MNSIKEFLKNGRALYHFWQGYNQFVKTGATSEEAYLAMRRLYYATGGRFNEWIAMRENRGHQYVIPDLSRGILGEYTPDQISLIKSEIDQEGYKVFPRSLDAITCAELIRFAEVAPSTPRGSKAFTFGEGLHRSNNAVYDRENPQSFIYDFDHQTLIDNPIIQNIVADETFLAIAKAYLGPCAIFQSVSMWWSTANFKQQNPDAAAQMYHTDLDTISWLNFFIYLTDVDVTNGAHTFVARTHKSKPSHLQREGRVRDEEVEATFPKEQIIEMIGKQGTIILEDTKGLHKGNALLQGERLMLQVRFATSLFGQPPKPVKVSYQAHRKFFVDTVKQKQDVYGNIIHVE